MNKAITEGLALMPPAFSQGLNLWSREDGLTGQGSWAGQSNAGLVPNDQDFEGCLEIEKTASTTKLRCFQAIPFQPGLYLRVTARVKAMSGAYPSVRIAGYAENSSGGFVSAADGTGPSVTLTTYGEVVTVTAIIASGNRTGVDMIWGTAPVLGHFGIDLTGANGGVVRIDDITIEDVSAIFHSVMFNWVDVRDYGAIGDGVTNDKAAFDAADSASQGRTIVVPPGTYFIGSNTTIDNPIHFEGTLTMAATTKVSLTRNFDLASYSAMMGSELEGFRRGLQALFTFTDHVEFSLSGRRVELTAPIDVATLAGVDDYVFRKVLSDGQITVVDGAAWDTTTVTAVADYSTANQYQLTGVTNIASIPVGARVSGTGVGREVYVRSVDIATSTVTLSRALFGGNVNNRTYTFNRYKYMLDFSGFNDLLKFEIQNIEFLCVGEASCVMLPKDGQLFRIANCSISKPKDRGVTSIGEGCQDLILDDIRWESNEQGLVVQDRTTICFNVNANDAKIRNNRASRFAHFGVLSGQNHMFVGNHFFGGDSGGSGIRRAGMVITFPNSACYFTGNYIDNCFLELSNEHDANPDFGSEYTFGACTVTGNTFVASNVAASFRWLVITPRGPGHSVQGLSVTGNVFRTVSSNVDRVEMVDTSFSTLSATSFKNVSFENNTFNGVDQPTVSPVMLEHNQASEAETWSVVAGPYMPFSGRARNVLAVIPEGAITDSGGTNRFLLPYTVCEQGSGGGTVNIRWGTSVKGKVWATIRCDTPI